MRSAAGLCRTGQAARQKKRRVTAACLRFCFLVRSVQSKWLGPPLTRFAFTKTCTCGGKEKRLNHTLRSSSSDDHPKPFNGPPSGVRASSAFPIETKDKDVWIGTLDATALSSNSIWRKVLTRLLHHRKATRAHTKDKDAAV